MANIRILVVDDDPNVQELVQLYLRREGFEIIKADSGEQAIELIKRELPQLVVLDIMLPGIDGWQVLARTRREGFTVPVLMLSAKGQEYDKVKGLELGADDYVTKPFSPLELVARVKALLRRARPQAANDEVTLPGLTINKERHLVLRNEKPISLTPKEFDLLFFLVWNHGRVFSREKLLQEVWGYDYPGDVRTVDVHIKGLRQKLMSPAEHWSIKTVWGIGYKFEVER